MVHMLRSDKWWQVSTKRIIVIYKLLYQQRQDQNFMALALKTKSLALAF